jgi:hypothetical protein
MKRLTWALGVVILASVLAAACGGGEPPAGSAEITLTTEPDPPRTGETTFEAMVMMGGQPVTDAEVSVELFMAAMPSMNMAEMRNSVPLTHAGGGRYRGAGNVMMAGNWDATVSVKQDGQELGARKVAITAK